MKLDMQIEKFLFRWKNEMGLNVCFCQKKFAWHFQVKFPPEVRGKFKSITSRSGIP